MSRYKVIREDCLNAYILDTEKNTIVALCSTKRPDLGFQNLMKLVDKANKHETCKKCGVGLDVCAVDDKITIRYYSTDDNGKPIQVSSWHDKAEVEKLVEFLNKFLGRKINGEHD